MAFHYLLMEVTRRSSGARDYADEGMTGELLEFTCAACNLVYNLPEEKRDDPWSGLKSYSSRAAYDFLLGESEPRGLIPENSALRLRCQYCLTHLQAIDNTLKPKGSTVYKRKIDPWPHPRHNLYVPPPHPTPIPGAPSAPPAPPRGRASSVPQRATESYQYGGHASSSSTRSYRNQCSRDRVARSVGRPHGHQRRRHSRSMVRNDEHLDSITQKLSSVCVRTASVVRKTVEQLQHSHDHVTDGEHGEADPDDEAEIKDQSDAGASEPESETREIDGDDDNFAGGQNTVCAEGGEEAEAEEQPMTVDEVQDLINQQRRKSAEKAPKATGILRSGDNSKLKKSRKVRQQAKLPSKTQPAAVVPEAEIPHVSSMQTKVLAARPDDRAKLLGGIRNVLTGQVDMDTVETVSSDRPTPYEAKEDERNPLVHNRQGNILNVPNGEGKCLKYLRESDRPEDYGYGYECNFEQIYRSNKVVNEDLDNVKAYNAQLRAAHGDEIDAVVTACFGKEKELDFDTRQRQWRVGFPTTCLEAYQLDGKICIIVEAVMDSTTHTGSGCFQNGPSTMPCIDFNTGGCDHGLLCRCQHCRTVLHVCTPFICGNCDGNCRVANFCGHLQAVPLAYAVPTAVMDDEHELVRALE